MICGFAVEQSRQTSRGTRNNVSARQWWLSSARVRAGAGSASVVSQQGPQVDDAVRASSDWDSRSACVVLKREEGEV
jgi:hypothetical protein